MSSGPDTTNGTRSHAKRNGRPSPNYWTSEELLAYAGLTYRQVDHWTRIGYLFPLDPSPGSGLARYFHIDEVKIARKMSTLLNAGLQLVTAAEVARYLIDHNVDRYELSSTVTLTFQHDR